MTEEVKITIQKKVSKEELFKFLGWRDQVVPVGTTVRSVPLEAEVTAILEVPEHVYGRAKSQNTELVITATYTEK